ncbi:peptidoglycan-binding domain-containing protein [Cellulomonas sp. URHB0016]
MFRRVISASFALLVLAGFVTAAAPAANAVSLPTCNTKYRFGIATDYPVWWPSSTSGDWEYECLLAQGNVGTGVKVLQTALKYCLGYDLGTSGVDGNFGPRTKSALQSFQRSNGLTADGIYGPNTLDRMKMPSEVPVSGSFYCRAFNP